MNNDEHKQNIKMTFDMASEGYDCPGLRFFVESASHLVESLQLKGDENLIDIATGTGNVAIEAARRLEKGSVTGIDLSDSMLQRAISKAEELNLTNTEFKCCDIEDMDFEDSMFDAASCAFGLFFLQNMDNGLKCISRVLKPGGQIALTSFTPSLMKPLRVLLVDRLKQYGIEPPPLSWMRIDTPDRITELLSSADYENISVQSRQLGYYLKDGDEWWNVTWNSGYRGLISRLSEQDINLFKKEHLKEVNDLADEKGIWLEVDVLFALATLSKD